MNRVQLPPTNTTLTTIHRLFQQTFPQHIQPGDLQTGQLDLHIKNGDTGLFEPLEGVEQVQDLLQAMFFVSGCDAALVYADFLKNVPYLW